MTCIRGEVKMAGCRRLTRRLACLGVLLSLSLMLGGCRSSMPTATMSFPPTPTSRPILTPLPGGFTPTAKPPCKPLPVASAIQYPGQVAMTWYAEQIVVGTIIAQETRWENNYDDPRIETYSLFHVEERVRGLPLDEILIKQAAGTLDGCTQQGSLRPLSRNGQMLLFLGYGDKNTPPIFSVLWGYNGIYGGPIEQGMTESRQTLSSPPPANISRDWITPLSRAPLVPPRVATPQP